jgi:hypothetical protein
MVLADPSHKLGSMLDITFSYKQQFLLSCMVHTAIVAYKYTKNTLTGGEWSCCLRIFLAILQGLARRSLERKACAMFPDVLQCLINC